MMDENQTTTTLPAVKRSLPNCPVSIEFINYIMALFILNVRYASVFWKCQKLFTFIFSCQLLISFIEHIFSQATFEILYKTTINQDLIDASLPIPYSVISVLQILSLIILMYLLSFTFDYGMDQFQSQQNLALQTLRLKCFDKTNPEPLCCQGYSIHCSSMIVLFFLIALKAPIVYEFVVIYKINQGSLILTTIIMEAVLFLVWVFSWFVFTVKTSWSFIIFLPLQNLIPAKVSGNSSRLNGNISSSTNDDSDRGNSSNLHVTSETPENTMKRNYRNSLRKKCGQFYRFTRSSLQSIPVRGTIDKKRKSHPIPKVSTIETRPPPLPPRVKGKIRLSKLSNESNMESTSSDTNVLCSQV